ncbi:WcaI family glycosyltransferase [Dyadobacter sp.]|uniref:WcaI family glycosyltransferase n=1 Tax=Dyadobacter sp. TaxID=1914288 RepID=UPI003F7238D6
MMRVLINGINYAPELTGIGKYTTEMAEWLANNGHDVTVIAAFPYYPEWSIHNNYRNRLWHKEIRNNVTIYRCPLYVPKNVNSKKRVLHEFSFFLSMIPVWLYIAFKIKFDIVISLNPPFHIGLIAVAYTKLFSSKSILHVQDLQVDAAKDLELIKSKFFLNIMFRVERFIMQRASLVTTISSGMKKKIQQKGLPESKVHLFPNWVDETLIRPLPMKDSMRSSLGFSEEDKIILYSGNIGEKQGLEIIVDVASSLAHRSDVHFVICGAGGGKDKLVKLVANSNLGNIHFFPLQPMELFSQLLAMADIHLVLQKQSASDLVMPSKLTGILAAGGCAIVSAVPGTSLYEVVQENNLGILVTPESVSDLLDGITMALNMDLTEYRMNSRRYASAHLSKESVLRKFESSLFELRNKTIGRV